MEIISSKNENPTRPYIAFFDLDQTIIRTNSGKAIILYALQKGLMPKIKLFTGVYLSILNRFNLKHPTKIINTMVSWLKGVSVLSLSEFSEETFKNKLLTAFHPDII